MASPIYDVVIIGAGPAGLTAGLYSAWAGLAALILERAFPGGQATKAERIWNYPGFPDGITGLDLAQLMQTQALKYGARIETRDVQRIAVEPDRIVLLTAGQEFSGRTAIIATGSDPRLLGVPGESRLLGQGVSLCAVCDGGLFQGKVVAVVGGGDAALAEALYLSKFCARVFVIHRRPSFRAARAVQDRLAATRNIEVVWNAVVREIRGERRVESLELLDVQAGASRALPVNGVFVSVGNEPNTGFARDVVELDAEGYVITDQNLATSQRRVFAGGDCRQKTLRQVSTAVGDGALAAASVEKLLALA
jgi:thioredoxin reductase (NADPH)